MILRYQVMLEQAKALIEGEKRVTPTLSNLSALIWESMDTINWAGFYVTAGEGKLLLGPFQGKPACLHIDFGRGVCGTAAATKRTQVVPDVHQFPGHIACDSDSRSEVVVPMLDGRGNVVAVLDMDSPVENRFGPDEVEALEAMAGLAAEHCDWQSFRP